MKKRRNSAPTVFTWIGVILALLLPLTGCVISFIYQVQIQQEIFGIWSEYKHIWGLYDLWNLTLLGYIPVFIWLND